MGESQQGYLCIVKAVLRRQGVLSWEGRALGALRGHTERKGFEWDQNAIARRAISCLSDFLQSSSRERNLLRDLRMQMKDFVRLGALDNFFEL